MKLETNLLIAEKLKSFYKEVIEKFVKRVGRQLWKMLESTLLIDKY